MVYNIDDLEIYQRAEKLSDIIWLEVNAWNDYFAKDTLGKQLVKAADSIGANIAEGFGRYHYKDNRNFCYYYSRGSLIETKGWLRKAKTRNLIAEQTVIDFLTELEQIHKMLNYYIKSIGTK